MMALPSNLSMERYGKFEAMILSKKIAFFREFCIIGKVV